MSNCNLKTCLVKVVKTGQNFMDLLLKTGVYVRDVVANPFNPAFPEYKNGRIYQFKHFGEFCWTECSYDTFLNNSRVPGCVVRVLYMQPVDCHAELERVQAQLNKSHDALQRLYFLKLHKNLNGKDTFYLKYQPEAWQQALDALNDAE